MTGIEREVARLRRQASHLTRDLQELEVIISEGIEPGKETKEIITFSEMAELLEVTHKTLRRYVKKGLLTPYRVGNSYVWHRSELTKQLEAATKAMAKEKKKDEEAE